MSLKGFSFRDFSRRCIKGCWLCSPCIPWGERSYKWIGKATCSSPYTPERQTAGSPLNSQPILPSIGPELWWPTWMSDEAPWPGDVAELVECSSSIHKTLCSNPRTALTKCDICILGYRVGSRPAWVHRTMSPKKKKIVSQNIPCIYFQGS